MLHPALDVQGSYLLGIQLDVFRAKNGTQFVSSSNRPIRVPEFYADSKSEEEIEQKCTNKKLVSIKKKTVFMITFCAVFSILAS